MKFHSTIAILRGNCPFGRHAERLNIRINVFLQELWIYDGGRYCLLPLVLVLCCCHEGMIVFISLTLKYS